MDKYWRTHAALRADPSLRDCLNLQPVRRVLARQRDRAGGQGRGTGQQGLLPRRL